MIEAVELIVESIDESSVVLVFPNGTKITWPKIYMAENWQVGSRVKMANELVEINKVGDILPLDLLNKLLRPS